MLLERPKRKEHIFRNIHDDFHNLLRIVKCEIEDDYGFNAKTEKYENLLKSGIIDPAKVVRVSLENAASVAGMLLTTECVLNEIEDKEGLKS